VTDRGTFERRGDRLVLTAVPEGPGPVDERVEEIRALCGWELEVDGAMAEYPVPTGAEVATLRRWDPRQRFLRPDD
jgi:hypothetical protein